MDLDHTSYHRLANIEIRDLGRGEADDAVALLARGMGDNPLNVAAHGENSERRRSLERVFGALLRIVSTQQPIGGFHEKRLVAVAGTSSPGGCQLNVIQQLRFLPEIVAIGPGASWRVRSWLPAWRGHDPDQPHSHLGPLAVDPDLRSRGVGDQIMSEYCRRLDCADQLSYLETDKAENVPFYERHGYAVIGEAKVIGVPNWFMSRQPRRSG